MIEGARGWYPDPNDARQERYWDGSAWKDKHRRRRGLGVEEPELNAYELAKARRTGNAPFWLLLMFYILLPLILFMLVLIGAGDFANAATAGAHAAR